MNLQLSKPILYLITRGASTETTTANSPEFKQILGQVSAATAAGIDLIQIREKRLTARVLFELASQAAALTRGSKTRLLINDRADVAAAAGADGVHLTTHSIDARLVRNAFGERFLIGVSTHSPAEIDVARNSRADFAVLGPVFETTSKPLYGQPLGLENFQAAVRQFKHFPIFALGGVSVENARECLRAGASGVAGISLFADPEKLKATVALLKSDLVDEERAPSL